VQGAVDGENVELTEELLEVFDSASVDGLLSLGG
jgi:hypothetical protein